MADVSRLVDCCGATASLHARESLLAKLLNILVIAIRASGIVPSLVQLTMAMQHSDGTVSESLLKRRIESRTLA